MLKVHGLDFFPFEVKRNYIDLVFGLFGFNIIVCISQNMVHLILDLTFGVWALKLKFSQR
jgi:hypothetical protein